MYRGKLPEMTFGWLDGQASPRNFLGDGAPVVPDGSTLSTYMVCTETVIVFPRGAVGSLTVVHVVGV